MHIHVLRYVDVPRPDHTGARKGKNNRRKTDSSGRGGHYTYIQFPSTLHTYERVGHARGEYEQTHVVTQIFAEFV